MTLKKRTSLFLVPFACCAMGALSLFLPGCGREEPVAEEPPPPHVPASYMNDPEFRKGLSDRNAAQRAIVSERMPLVRRMEELVREHGEDTNKLQKISEWNELYRKVTELNAKYEAGRKDLLKYARERITPKHPISK